MIFKKSFNRSLRVLKIYNYNKKRKVKNPYIKVLLNNQIVFFKEYDLNQIEDIKSYVFRGVIKWN